MRSKSFQITAVRREDEVQRIATTLASLPGVKSVLGDRRTKIFAITWNEPTTLADISKSIAKLGYVPQLK